MGSILQQHGIWLLLHPAATVFMDSSCSHSLKWLPGPVKKKNLVLPALSSSFCVYAFIAVDWSVICLNNKYTISEPDVLPSSSSLDFAVNRISPRASTDSGSDQ